MSGGLMSGGRMSGGRLSGGIKSYDRGNCMRGGIRLLGNFICVLMNDDVKICIQHSCGGIFHRLITMCSESLINYHDIVVL